MLLIAMKGMLGWKKAKMYNYRGINACDMCGELRLTSANDNEIIIVRLHNTILNPSLFLHILLSELDGKSGSFKYKTFLIATHLSLLPYIILFTSLLATLPQLSTLQVHYDHIHSYISKYLLPLIKVIALCCLPFNREGTS